MRKKLPELLPELLFPGLLVLTMVLYALPRTARPAAGPEALPASTGWGLSFQQ